MRVIAGQWRGRCLKAPVGKEVRPTTDRTKEALFNILGPQVAGAVVLDLCCGAGGLGIEALSRGAAQAFFIDLSRGSLQATQANLERCGAADGTYQLSLGHALDWISGWRGTAAAPWLLLCDPPYNSPVAASMINWLESASAPAGMGLAVVEYGPGTPGIPEFTPAWQVRRYGESHLAIFKPGAAAPEQE